MSQPFKQIGFIGLGVMGEPMCRNLAVKSGIKVIAFDLDASPLQRIAAHGVRTGGSVRAVVEGSDVVFLSLPSGEVVSEVAHAADGLLASIKAGQVVVDLSTSPVDLTRQLAQEFAGRSTEFIDAPVARTRAAAEAGTLSVMVGGDRSLFDRLRPLIATFATEITHCGPVGCGQVVKILNNMILFQIGVAIAEAKVIGERSGVDPALLFDTLAKGSADSFALRNHGMKAMLPAAFPPRAFSVQYARKDLKYALRLAQQARVDAQGARNVDILFGTAIDAGFGEQYWPVISRLIGA
ncbi:MAG: NAD(P)-dependent oxidoreductase [Sulfuricaulis sp.]|nr:NAD(P)-dependent oxidoreductase [Sulfuricaulis sp.]